MADKRRTLFDRITGANKFVANEEKVHNPFKVKIGTNFHLDTLKFRGAFYNVKRLEVLDRGTGVLMADYVLEAGVSTAGKVLTEENKSLILRTVPRDGETGKNKIDFRIIVLSKYYECAWDDESRPGLMEGVTDPAGEFVINANTEDERKFWRLQGLKTAENVNVTVVKDSEGDVELKRLELWGFSRTTQDEAHQEVNEYLYVQKDCATGWLEVFIGREVPPERINV